MEIKDFKKIFSRVPRWPKDAQEELVRSMAEIESRYTNVYKLDDEERAALNRSAADIRHGRFANEEAIDQVFGKFRRA